MKYISETELQERIMKSLRERNLVVEREAGYSTWNEIKIVKDDFAGGLEKVVRDLITEV
jgi:hypothetical protein